MQIRRMSVGTLALAIPAVMVSSFLPGRLFSALRQPAKGTPASLFRTWVLASPQQTQPSSAGLLRTTTNLVQLSVIATDKKGQPVEELTTDDFVVLDNGHPQNIAIFRKERNQLPVHAPAPLPPDTCTNQFSATGNVPASVTMLLLDGLNTGYFALPEPAPTAESLRAIITSALASPLDSTGLALAVRMKAATQETGTATTAMIFFDPRAIKLEPNASHFNGNVAMVLAQLNQKNEVVHADQQSLPLSFDSQQYQQFLKQQVALTQQINLAPNAERLRVLLCDGTTGRVGAVTVPLAKYQPSKPPANSSHCSCPKRTQIPNPRLLVVGQITERLN